MEELCNAKIKIKDKNVANFKSMTEQKQKLKTSKKKLTRIFKRIANLIK